MRCHRIAVTVFVGLVIAIPSFANAEGFALWIANVGRLMSANKVSTKQVELSNSRSDQAAVDIARAQASASLDMYNRRMVKRVVDEFGHSSQLVDPCYQVSMANTAVAAVGGARAGAQAAMQNIYRVDSQGNRLSGGLSGVVGNTESVTAMPFAANVATRIYRHETRYCTVSEAQSGLCALNANGMQGADSDFSMLAVPGKTWGWDQTEAANDFVKIVAPVKAISKTNVCSDPACLTELAGRRQKEAYLSMARFSMLRFAESHTTQSGTDVQKGS
jgi:hypothetical protein